MSVPDKLKINRRDFLNGVALSLTAGTSLSPLELLAMEQRPYYPPRLTGLRGSHTGSFEVAHAVTQAGKRFARPADQTDDLYDLVVVGGGISGLATALLYRQRVGAGAKILVLDNHDDFGGHAKRNEFDVDGEKLIGYGGSQSIDSPGQYSPAAKQLLKDVVIETDRFYDYYDQEYFRKRKLVGGVWFSEEAFGSDVLAYSAWPSYFSTPAPATIEATIASYPISDESKTALSRLLQDDENYLADLNGDEKVEYLRQMSYREFLLKHTGATEEVADILNDSVRGYWGLGWDALSALEGYRLSQPGTWYLGLDNIGKNFADREEPYIFHFPDGNAGIARSIVRKLIPEAAPGQKMESLITTPVDYSLLDVDSSKVRIRLNSTCVDVRHTTDQKAVDVSYFQNGSVHRVRGKHAVLAC
jgi:spermidine dehydrogenase